MRVYCRPCLEGAGNLQSVAAAAALAACSTHCFRLPCRLRAAAGPRRAAGRPGGRVLPGSGGPCRLAAVSAPEGWRVSRNPEGPSPYTGCAFHVMCSTLPARPCCHPQVHTALCTLPPCKALPVRATCDARRMLLSLEPSHALGYPACSSGNAPTAGPGLLLNLAEGGSYAAIGLGLAVLALQVRSTAGWLTRRRSYGFGHNVQAPLHSGILA
jgi:hypothetical protein